jgi:hypothetical protein
MLMGLCKSEILTTSCHSRTPYVIPAQAGIQYIQGLPGSPLEFTLAKAGAEMTKILGFLQSLKVKNDNTKLKLYLKWQKKPEHFSGFLNLLQVY